MACQIMYSSVLLVALWAGAVKAQFNAGSCVSLQPISGNVQQGTAPFFVASTSGSYTPGGNTISVFLASTTTVVASNILLQARRVGSTNVTPVGSFDLPADNLYQYLTCATSQQGTIVSLNQNSKTLNLQFIWTPPANAVGDVEFIASLVETNNNAWLSVNSNPVTGPPEVVIQLTIDNCPTPNVAANGVLTYQPPVCRRGGVSLGGASCTPPSTSTLPAGDSVLTCTCADSGDIETCSVTVTGPVQPTGCNPSPCLNGGTCISVPQLPSGFFCQCIPGSTGTTCADGGPGGPLTFQPCPPDLNNFGNTYVWTAPSCTRNGNAAGEVVCNPPSGTTFTGQSNPITCTCTAGDETATCDFNINAVPVGPVCQGNPCGGLLECRELGSALAGYTCHSSTGTPCP